METEPTKNDLLAKQLEVSEELCELRWKTESEAVPPYYSRIAFLVTLGTAVLGLIIYRIFDLASGKFDVKQFATFQFIRWMGLSAVCGISLVLDTRIGRTLCMVSNLLAVGLSVRYSSTKPPDPAISVACASGYFLASILLLVLR